MTRAHNHKFTLIESHIEDGASIEKLKPLIKIWIKEVVYTYHLQLKAAKLESLDVRTEKSPEVDQHDHNHRS